MRPSFVNNNESGSSTICSLEDSSQKLPPARLQRTAVFDPGITAYPMATKLDKTIRREIEIDGEAFTIAISPDGFRLTKKRFRSGVALSWKSLWARRGNDASSSTDSPEER